MHKKILVTGANGFIGSALTRRLAQNREWEIRGALRRIDAVLAPDVRPVVVGDLGPETDWQEAVAGVDCVVHTAGRAHVLKTEPDAVAAFHKANVEGTLAIARQAARAKVKRFVFISSIGVNGGRTYATPFTEDAAPAPHAEYARSKLEAEQALVHFCSETDMELTIVRPPLVYHFDAPGNFARLLAILAKGWPLPFGAVSNMRSFVSLTNLVDFIRVCIEHPAARNQTFLVADGDDVSLPQMIGFITEGMRRKVSLVPIPVWFLANAARCAGKYGMFEQLCGSLQIDISKARRLLGWHPPLSAKEGFCCAGDGYVNERRYNVSG